VLQQNWSQLALELRRTQTLRPDFLKAPGEVSSEN
jgi:arogenate dehydrogenase (NADP+)